MKRIVSERRECPTKGISLVVAKMEGLSQSLSFIFSPTVWRVGVETLGRVLTQSAVVCRVKALGPGS